MAEDRVQRRLAAILAADMSGYSRLMAADEEGTHARLRGLRAELVDPKIAEYGGRVFKTTGDGLLVEFPSAVDALKHALDIQRAMARRNADIRDDRRIEFRVGIGLGDVIVDGSDLYGNGVNLAARLEGLAEPGGICVSASVREQVESVVAAEYEDLGEQQVKNIDRPVRCYRVAATGSRDSAFPAAARDGIPRPADKPSIAVLPFDNLSGDPAQDFIGDGLTEDLITALSAIRAFFVIARNSTFHYKGAAPDVRTVARELSVRYIVEGSVRRAGDRLRITAQLIDGQTGNHLWAERYDRELADLFDIQDEITRTIVGRLEPELGRAEYERARAKPPENLDAWELYHRGMVIAHRRTKEALVEARRLFEQAIEKDPNMARAYAALSWTLVEEVLWGALDEYDRERSIRLAKRAIELDDRDAFAHFALGWAYFRDRQMDLAAAEAEIAVRLNPSFSLAHVLLSGPLVHGGRPQEGIPHLELARWLSPSDENFGLLNARLGCAYLYLNDYERAVEAAKIAVQHDENWLTRTILTSALGHLGRDDEARSACEALQAVQPGITTAFVGERYMTAHKPSMDHLIEGLRKAGLPDA